MKMTIRLFVTILSLSFLFSCSKNSKQGSMIPKNASLAVIVNGGSVSEKLPWAEVKTNELFQQMYMDTSLKGYIKAALDNPENTGIDTKSDMVFYIMRDTSGGYVVFKGTVKDEAKFKAFNGNIFKGNTSAVSGYTTMSNEDATAVWDKEHFAILINAPMLNAGGMYSGNYNSNFKRDFKAMIPEILSPKKSNTLAEDKRFNKLMEDKSDVAFWMNIEELNRGSVALAAISMMNMSKLYEGSVVTATMNFENGKIDVDAISYSGKELTDIWKKYSRSSFDQEMLSKIPTENVAVLFALAFKPEGLKEFIKVAGMEGLVNMGSAVAGFTMDDFVKAINGDILFAMNMPRISDSNSRMMPDFLFASSVNDKASFDKLINAGKKMGGESNPENFTYQTDGKYFAIGNGTTMVAPYFNQKASDKAFMKDLKNDPFLGYIDLQLILKSIPAESDSFTREMINASVVMWDKVLINGGDFKNDGIHQHMEVSLMNKNINSLKALNEYLGKIGSIQKKRKESYDSVYAQ